MRVRIKTVPFFGVGAKKARWYATNLQGKKGKEADERRRQQGTIKAGTHSQCSQHVPPLRTGMMYVTLLLQNNRNDTAFTLRNMPQLLDLSFHSTLGHLAGFNACTAACLLRAFGCWQQLAALLSCRMPAREMRHS